MKKLLLLLILAFGTQAAFASHGMGGELTWTCNGTDYVFQLKFYRDCNGIPGPQTITLENDVPGLGGISMSLISQTDISPVGSDSSGMYVCPTCPTGGPGAVEEFVFESNPVAIAGVPPSGGWTFWYGSCCRSGSLLNITNGGSYGFALRAKMYPFTGQVAGQCSDASPSFAEKPSVITCTGSDFSYSHFASDIDRDSLVYAFDIPLDDNGSPPTQAVPFAPGYSVNSPLPGPAINPQNVAATLDPGSGEIDFMCVTPGYFVTCVRVSSYRCGQLTAEIFREINVVLANCGTIPVVNLPNMQPGLVAPFVDSNSVAVYDTTVQAGDTLQFILTASDTDYHPVDTFQMVTLNAAGDQYGAGFTNTSSGCLIPPCATLTPPPPVTGKAATSTQFDWTTTTAHLGLNFGCVYLGNVYYFLNKGTDNFCPANGQSVDVIKITVLPNVPQPPVVNNGGTLTCLLFTGAYSYQWFKDRFAIPGATGQSYTVTAPGLYQVLAWDPQTGDGNYSEGIQITTTDMEELPGIDHLSVFPNPSENGIVQVLFESIRDQDVTIRVSDVTGRSVFVAAYRALEGRFEASVQLNEPGGVYFLEIETKNGSVMEKLLLK